ncbi:MAG: hypothetical protein HY044_00765 [Candidatus Woesebacteria bacterium]|nr:MAG: hypothetical protein HY044_00765 [Candidatus Woesebacteria bacterium]
MKYKKDLLIVLAIFLFGFAVRFWSIYPANTIIGFDQARDLWDVVKIFRDHDLRIIGPVAGNNPNLHHGVLYLHYLIFPLIVFHGNPAGAAIWNSIFNSLTAVVLYFFAKSLFKSKSVSLISSLTAASSYQLVSFSGWLSNPSPTILTVPIFFYGLWKYYKKRNWGLVIAFLFLGLSIQLELFFVYLIPITLIVFLVLRMKLPSLKLLFACFAIFAVSTSTMILAEVKLHFEGIKSIFSAGSFVGGVHRDSIITSFSSFVTRMDVFRLNFWPSSYDIGFIFGGIVLVFFLYELVKNRSNKKVRNRDLFLIIYFLSPSIMLFLGSHNAPWFLIGRPASAILMGSYVLSKVKPKFLVFFAVVFIILGNLLQMKGDYGKGQVLLEPDESSIMSEQISAVDFTYNESKGEKFTINTLTNPLYINAVWSYHYFWYGESKYGYLPTWGGGDQLYPYNVLGKENGKEKYLYLLIDKSYRIPPQYKKELIDWANGRSKLISEKDFGGILVQKREFLKI